MPGEVRRFTIRFGSRRDRATGGADRWGRPRRAPRRHQPTGWPAPPRHRADRPPNTTFDLHAGMAAFAELRCLETEPQTWLARLRAVAAGRSRVPAPTLWISPALVVTGAMAARALCAALEHEPTYPAETIDSLMQEADVDEDEAASMFEDLTGKPLRPRTAR